MKTIILAGGAALVIAAGLYLTQGSHAQETTAPPEGAPLVEVTLPATLSPEAQMGKQAFDAACAKCHGANGSGSMGFGPPLVHVIYEPNHHGDRAFYIAVQQGVRAHHWPFGNMPPQPGLTPNEVTSNPFPTHEGTAGRHGPKPTRA